MSDALLKVRHVSVAFGGLQALSDVSFDLGRAEMLGIIGPNGAGKTTLLNTLSRFVEPQKSGVISLDGTEILSLRPEALVDVGLGRTFQTVELSGSDTVLDNVLAGASRAFRGSGLAACFLAGAWGRKQRREISDLALSTLETFSLSRWASEAASAVPYAIKKRVQICRALMGRPKLLLLDEPASGMELREKLELQEALANLHASSGMSMVLIEHDVNFLTGLCPRMLALDFGKVIACGETVEVVKAPAVVSAYIGVDEI